MWLGVWLNGFSTEADPVYQKLAFLVSGGENIKVKDAKSIFDERVKNIWLDSPEW